MNSVEDDFANAEDLERQVDRAFEQLDREQPLLARFLARAVDPIHDDTAQALGHFLGVAVHRAFAETFGARLASVDEQMLGIAASSMEWDEELRRGTPDEVLESDDVVAMAQPHVVAFVREQLDAALEPDEDGDAPEVDLEQIDKVYRTILVEILALSQAVAPPRGITTTRALA